jgi:GNAT superfamily N-acetyltransferase
VTQRAVDAALLDEWRDWLGPALKRCASSGIGRGLTAMTAEQLRAAATSPDVLYAAAIHRGDARGLVVVTHARWEERVIGRGFAKVAALLADDYATALELARGALVAAADADVVLLSLRLGDAPAYLHAGLSEAGFHVGSEGLTLRADVQALAPRIAKLPTRGVFRPARAGDADAIADISRRAFTGARYMSDPHFPAEYGARIYEAWARALVGGGADVVIVAEEGGRIQGFVSVSLEYAKRPPGLLAVDPRYDGSGVGAMLVRSYLDWFRERGATDYRPRTERNNAGINAVYLALGFEIVDTDITYHASPALPPLRERLKNR